MTTWGNSPSLLSVVTERDFEAVREEGDQLTKNNLIQALEKLKKHNRSLKLNRKQKRRVQVANEVSFFVTEREDKRNKEKRNKEKE